MQVLGLLRKLLVHREEVGCILGWHAQLVSLKTAVELIRPLTLCAEFSLLQVQSAGEEAWREYVALTDDRLYAMLRNMLSALASLDA